MDHTNNRRVALVTGASRNIGRAIACGLAREGINVTVHAGHDREAANQTAVMVQQYGADAMVCIGDLANPDISLKIIEDIILKFGRLDILVNNAAIRPETSFAEMTYSEWRAVMSVCLDAAFLLTHSSLKYLEAGDHASIINIGGLTGHTGAVNRAHVIAAKAGLVGFTRALAHELTPKGVTVNCVVPGLIDTVRAGTNGKSPQHHATTTNLVGHRGAPSDVAEAVVYLTGKSARYITGQTLHVNGGAFLP